MRKRTRKPFGSAVHDCDAVAAFFTTAKRDHMQICICKTQKYGYVFHRSDKESQMFDIRRAILDALPKHLLLDLEDRLRAEAHKAHEVVRKELSLNPKRSREAEGQIRFRLQEEGYEEVVKLHGGHLLADGVMLGTDLKIFQPFARFVGPQLGVILGFAAMAERRKIPPKNMSRTAGVTINVHLRPSLFIDEKSPRPSDVFVLFLTARDRMRAGMIEEIAIGVIGSDYKDFVFYESLEKFLSGYAADSVALDSPDGSSGSGGGAKVVKLRQTRKPFIPPEKLPDSDADDETAR